MISAPPDRCPTCSGAIIDDDGPVCIMCGRTPVGALRFRLPETEELVDEPPNGVANMRKNIPELSPAEPERQEERVIAETIPATEAVNGNLTQEEVDRLTTHIMAGMSTAKASEAAGIEGTGGQYWVSRYASEEVRGKARENGVIARREANTTRIVNRRKVRVEKPAPEPLAVAPVQEQAAAPEPKSVNQIKLVEDDGPDVVASPRAVEGLLRVFAPEGTVATVINVGSLRLADLALLDAYDYEQLWASLGRLIRAKAIAGK